MNTSRARCRYIKKCMYKHFVWQTRERIEKIDSPLTPHYFKKMFYKLEPNALVLFVKVSANASKTEFKKQRTEDCLDIKVAAQREKGQANDELVEYLSKLLKIPESHIEIESGSTAPRKRLRITTPDPQKCLEILQKWATT